MSIETVKYKFQEVPEFITKGNHARFIEPIAREICKGIGYDIGCGKIEWVFNSSMPIDPIINKYSANNLPDAEVDYIFSSHLLEHLDNYYEILEYWYSKLKQGGNIFLYLPHPDCLYWHPTEQQSKRHKHIITPKIIEEALVNTGFSKVFVSGKDPAYSFCAYATKPYLISLYSDEVENGVNFAVGTFKGKIDYTITGNDCFLVSDSIKCVKVKSIKFIENNYIGIYYE